MRHPALRLLGLACVLVAGCPAAQEGSDDAGVSSDATTDVGGDASAPDAASDAGTCDDDSDCEDGLFCTTERCTAGRCASEPTSCDDAIACTSDTCVEGARRCEHAAPDLDGDGSGDAACVDERGTPIGEDCDDGDPLRAPGNVELCDAMGHDEDCDPSTRGGTDDDGDGYESSACCAMGAGGTPSCGGDCRDDDPSIHPTSSEVCNAIDDDCDGRVDDIIEGTVICASGDTRPCTTSCGLAGTQRCNDSCLGWDTCSAPEICNGCDDDNDGADDEDFECVLGESSTCTTSCGTTGTHLCDGSCAFTTCEASEICNYCDDDADGNYFEERPLATFTANESPHECGAVFGGATCTTTSLPSGRGYERWATLIDGTADNQAGAMWLEPSWTMGWGTIEIAVELEAVAMTTSPTGPLPRQEQALGGWAIVVGRGSSDVGTPDRYGIPTTIDGVAARWSWSQFDGCYGYPPSNNEGVRGLTLRSGGITPLIAAMAPMDSSCFTGDGLDGSSTTFDGPASGTRTQRMVLRYTPDDPSTPAVREEALEIVATAGVTTTKTYVPRDALPVGSGPLRIGFTAASFTRTGIPHWPADMVFGVPIRARIHVEHFDMSASGTITTTRAISGVRAGICP